MKLYTRSGDDGSTGLFGGQRVPKNDLRVEAYGCVDELNACIGWALVTATTMDVLVIRPGKLKPMREILEALQSRLFDLGADLATPAGSKHESKVARIDESHVLQTERWIDEIDAGNDAMSHFVLPGGTELAARLHIARTVCRRAERAMVGVSQTENINAQAIIFINRVSDLLFAMARLANKLAGVPDVPWVPGRE